MSDIQISIRSNVDALSATVLHEAFVSVVRNTLAEAKAAARTAAPKRTRLLEAHIESSEVHDLADAISGSVGVTPVREADARRSRGEYKRSQYPLFVEGGTRSPIFPAASPFLVNKAEGIFHRSSVRGQDPQPFMAGAYAAGLAAAHTDPSVELALKEMEARALAELPLVDRP